MPPCLSLSPLSFSLPQCHHQFSQLQHPLNVGSHCDLNYFRSQKSNLFLFAGMASFDGQFTKSTSSWAVDLVGKSDRLLPKQDSCFGEYNGRLPTNREEEFNQNLVEEREREGLPPTSHRAENIDLIQKNGIRHTKEGKEIAENLNNLLVELFESDELEIADELFDKLPSLVPDSRTFAVMVRCYCIKNDLDKARQVLDDMVGRGLRPNVATFTILINGYCRRGRLQKALEVFEVMGRIGCEPTVHIYNCLLHGLCYVGRVEEAFELLMKMKNSSKKPNIYTYTEVMNGFCKVGRSDEANELLKEALEMGLNPTVVTFNTLFNGYCKEGRPLKGISLLKQMKEKDCQPDYITYSTLLHGLLKWSEIHVALQIYKEMLGVGFEVDERMMNILLRGICRRSWTDGELLKDAEELFDRIKKVGSGPHPATYCLMIQSLSIKGKIDRALAILHEMVRLGYPPKMVTFNTVIRALCGEGRVEDALLVLVVMFGTSTSRGRISYNLIIDELNRQGRLLGASEVYGAALKRGVIPHCKPRKNIFKG